jgi:hypothetical protein
MTSIKKISSKEHNIDLRLSKISSFDLSALTMYMPPLKLEKIRFFGVKSWFLTRNTPKMFAPPSAIGMQVYISGADPGFKVRGARLKKIAPSRGRRENVCGISCEKSRFYAKKSYFFQLRREARTFLGYFVWEITARPPNFKSWIRPWYVDLHIELSIARFFIKQYM